ncbi:hypothetical protein EB796_017823 [Bugula neritina]|uniref:Uncharacterized protein n=1 Tax=Bugula neritina TaxID=10212 RepID=A0A7J7JE28_BUGNE|nr:hypothetical protein EB796_017823 [Bugula neritina]
MGAPPVVEKTNLLLGDQIKKARRAGLDLSRMLVCCQICDNVWGQKAHPILDYIQDHVNTREHTKVLVPWLMSHPNQRYQDMLTIPPANHSGEKRRSLEENLKGAYFCEICEVPAGYNKKDCKKHLKNDLHIKKMLKMVGQLQPQTAVNQNDEPTELRDVEYILVAQRLPKLTRDKDRFKTFPCQTCAVAANDVAQLTFDNWVEHMSTQFHMSILYDWLARCKAPAALPYRHMLNFKPYEIKEKEKPHFFCEICSKRVEHVDELIQKHLESDKHKAKFYELKQRIDQALSGGPVTRILPDEDMMDTYPDDIDMDWRHPDDIRRAEMEEAKRRLEEDQRRQMEEQARQQKLDQQQQHQQMEQQQKLEQRRQEQRSREAELRDLREQEMQLLREQREKNLLTEKEFEDQQCKLMLKQQKMEVKQNSAVAPENAPLQFRNGQQQMSMDNQSMPMNNQQMPMNNQQMPMNNQQMPMNNQQMPMNNQQIPMNNQQMPMNYQQMPMNNQQMPMNNQQMPMNNQQMPMNNQQMPMNSQQMPMNNQQKQINNMQMPTSQQIRPNQQLSINQKQSPNQQMPMNQHMGPNQQMPMNQQMGPNQQMPMNQQMGPNQQMPMNQQMGPNQQMPMNQQMGPNQQMPINQQMGLNQQMPINQQMGPNQQMPNQRMPMGQQMPMNQPMAMNAQQMPMNMLRMPMNQQMGQQRVMNPQQMSMNMGMPFNQMQPLNQQQMMPNQQRMPFNKLLPPNQSMGQNKNTHMSQKASPAKNPNASNSSNVDDSPSRKENNMQQSKSGNAENDSLVDKTQKKSSKKKLPPARVANPNTELLRQLNLDYAKEINASKPEKGDPRKPGDAGASGTDNIDTPKAGETSGKPKDAAMVKSHIPRNRGPHTYVLFPQRLEILATLSEFPLDAYCEVSTCL